MFVQGKRRLMTSNVRRAQIRHVVGRLDVDVVGGLERRIAVVSQFVTGAHQHCADAAESTMGRR